MLTTTEHPYSLELADIDGDGHLDVVVVHADEDVVGVYLGDGRGGLKQKGLVSTGNGPTHGAVADIDHDGRLDYILCEQAAQAMAVFRGDGHGGLAAHRRFAFDSTCWQVALPDLNADGYADIFVTVGANDVHGAALLYMNDGAGSYLEPRSFRTSPNATLPGPATADFNGDGHTDLALGGPPARIWYGDGTGGFSAQGLLPDSPFESAGVATAISSSESVPPGVAVGAAESVAVWANDGRGAFVGPALVSVAGPRGGYVGELVSDDVDCDGRADLLVATGDGLVVVRGAGDLRFGDAELFATDYPPFDIATGDLDEDGLPDVVLALYTRPALLIRLNRSR